MHSSGFLLKELPIEDNIKPHLHIRLVETVGIIDSEYIPGVMKEKKKLIGSFTSHESIYCFEKKLHELKELYIVDENCKVNMKKK